MGCNHAVGICDDRDKAGGAADGAAGTEGGGDIRGVQLAGCCKHEVVVWDYGDTAGRADEEVAKPPTDLYLHCGQKKGQRR